MRILVVEDDRLTRDYIEAGLADAGHNTESAKRGDVGLAMALDRSYEAIVLDRMLPGLDGLTVLMRLRAKGINTPVLLLTAVGDVDDRVEGLQAGADDYLVKPFVFRELAARIAAIAKRTILSETATILRVVGLEMNLVNRVVRRDGVPIDLLPKEFALLEFLMRHQSEILSKAMLLERVWKIAFNPKTSIVETHISRLRSKIDKPFDAPLLETVKNVGYRLRAPD